MNFHVNSPIVLRKVVNVPRNTERDDVACESLPFQNLQTTAMSTEGEIMVGTWLGEYCRQVEAEEVSNSRNKIHKIMYQPLFLPL